jgi:hypothetical protein
LSEFQWLAEKKTARERKPRHGLEPNESGDLLQLFDMTRMMQMRRSKRYQALKAHFRPWIDQREFHCQWLTEKNPQGEKLMAWA